jgi:hypothetical protein
LTRFDHASVRPAHHEGRPDLALPWLARAEAGSPENLEIRTKRALAEALVQKGERASDQRPA